MTQQTELAATRLRWGCAAGVGRPSTLRLVFFPITADYTKRSPSLPSRRLMQYTDNNYNLFQKQRSRVNDLLKQWEVPFRKKGFREENPYAGLASGMTGIFAGLLATLWESAKNPTDEKLKRDAETAKMIIAVVQAQYPEYFDTDSNPGGDGQAS